MYDREHFFAAVVGGGPAGAQCALWLKNLGVPVILFEKEARLGGLQRTVPDPLSNHYVVSSAGMRAGQIAEAIHENVCRHGVPFVCAATVGEVEDDGQWFHLSAKTAHGTHHAYAKYLVIATGVRQREAEFTPSETVFIGSADPRIRGGDFFRDKRIAVLGGGDNAMECYGFLKLQNPQAVHVYARTLRAGPKHLSMVDRADLNEGGYNVLVRKDGGPHCVTVSDDPYSRMLYDYLIVNYGFEAPRFLSPALDPKRNEQGFIEVDSDTVTSNPRILALGESTQRMHPCVATSMADGVVAAKKLEALFVAEKPTVVV